MKQIHLSCRQACIRSSKRVAENVIVAMIGVLIGYDKMLFSAYLTEQQWLRKSEPGYSMAIRVIFSMI